LRHLLLPHNATHDPASFLGSFFFGDKPTFKIVMVSIPVISSAGVVVEPLALLGLPLTQRDDAWRPSALASAFCSSTTAPV